MSVIQRTVQLAAKFLANGTFDISIKMAGQKELCVGEQVKLVKKIAQALQWIVNIFIFFWQWLGFHVILAKSDSKLLDLRSIILSSKMFSLGAV